MLKNSKYLYGERDVLIPANVNFGEHIIKKLWLFKNNVALINGVTNESLTYGQIAIEAMNLAISLVYLGVRKGDIIAIVSENRREYFSTTIGGACTGATISTINPFYTKGEITHVLALSKPKYVFCSPFAFESHKQTLQTTTSIKKIIIYGTRVTKSTIPYDDLVIPLDRDERNVKIYNGNVKNSDIQRNNEERQTTSDNVKIYSSSDFKRLMSDVKIDDFEAVDVIGQTDTVFILYSSGTTGLSKGVMLTHYNVVALCGSLPVDYCEGVVLSVGPWFHTMGLMGTLVGFVEGRTFAYLPKFDIHLYLETIQKYKVTMLFVAPAILVAIIKTKTKYDVSSVRRIVSGSAPLHPDVIKNVLPIFPNLKGIMLGYGMTETTLGVTRNLFADRKMLNGGSVGKVLPNMIVKIVDSHQRPLGPNQRGEVRVKGDLVMKGYLGGTTAAAFDDEGFLKTGDVGYYNDEGYMYVVDRLKELIKYKGYQVPPAEIEGVLLQHEAVKEAAVVGLQDLDAGELPLAFVCLQPGRSVTEREIQDYVAEKLSKTKRLRGGVRFLQEIPRNSTGKILRTVLKDIANSAKNQ